MRVKISGNLMCYNEADNIERCITNLLPYVDELLIVDGGSTDGTIDIINKFTDKKIKLKVIPQGTEKLTRWDRTFDLKGVKAQKWNQPYRRNFLIDSSSYDWILTKDADEDFGEELKIFLSNCNFSDIGYKFHWYHVFRKKNELVIRTDGPWNPKSAKISLFQKKLFCYENILVHCNMIYRDGRKTPWKNMQHVDVPLWHYPFMNEEVTGRFEYINNTKFKIPKYVQDFSSKISKVKLNYE